VVALGVRTFEETRPDRSVLAFFHSTEVDRLGANYSVRGNMCHTDDINDAREPCAFCQIALGAIDLENDLAIAIPDGFPLLRSTPLSIGLPESRLSVQRRD
jgi:hypothetical protein